MSFETDTLELASAVSGPRRPEIGLHPLQQAAVRLGDYRDGRSRVRAKDLVGLLLCHGARAWRSAQPQGDIRLQVEGRAGYHAVRLSFSGTRRR
ncbi:hypothetical protein [Aureimonas sp. AU4]|uniref:hypothetical protein n=1 Tax=Aureimonas sp. AU4 TaxID=1638163 RepID=UPI0007860D7B|nr:hypothetical protein [Aureimonas sp. AU4]